MLEPILCGQPCLAPLLPKLRGHFAEFLDSASPVGLGILSPSTCVGLRYGYGTTIAAFLGTCAACFATLSSLRVTPSDRAAGLPPALLLRLHRFFLSRHMPSICVPAVLLCRSAGISTCCPSATLFSLALGPDLPGADQLYPGNLGYSAKRIPTSFSLLIPAFSLLNPPLLLAGTASAGIQCSSTKNPHRGVFSRASAVCFSPGHFRRGTSRLVSCYALFECVAASEPTS